MVPAPTTPNRKQSSQDGLLRPLYALQDVSSSSESIPRSTSSTSLDLVYEISKSSITIAEKPFAIGGNADIFVGKWTAPGELEAREVAVKMLRFGEATVVVHDNVTGKPLEKKERLDRRLAREMRILKKVHHLNINSLFGYIDSENNPLGRDSPCLVSPLHRRGNLRGFLKTVSPDVDRLKLLEQVANALTCMHEYEGVGIAHLDIKPENILVTDAGDAMICDMGLSKVLDGAKTGMTTGGGAAWSLPYAAKEVLMDEEVTKSADVHSFGFLILEVLSGLPPFYKQIKSRGAMTLHVSKGDIPLRVDHPIQGPSDAVEKVWELIGACCVGDPQARLTMPQVEKHLRIVRKLMSA